jgi:Transglutaminase-like superfamily
MLQRRRWLSQHWVTFPNREAKFAWMSAHAYRDVGHPLVQRWAEMFRPIPRPQRERAILSFVTESIRYEPDPQWVDAAGEEHGIEVLDSSAIALERGFGDCDVKSRLLVALCTACGVPCRLSPVFRGATGFPHVRNEIQGVDGMWRLADPSILNSSIGVIPERPVVATELRGLRQWRER